MIGLLGGYSAAFLKAFSVITLLAFAIPLAVAPLGWARVLKWEIDSKPHLALYFGRCLGAVAVVISCAAWYAAVHPEVQRFYFGMQIGIALLVGIAQHLHRQAEIDEAASAGGGGAIFSVRLRARRATRRSWRR